MMDAPLTGKQKRYLRGLGHKLKPMVQVGKGGCGTAVLAQVEECLLAHELVKVRVLESCPLDEAGCGAAIQAATGAQVAQKLGHTLLVYRPHPQQPVLILPAVS